MLYMTFFITKCRGSESAFVLLCVPSLLTIYMRVSRLGWATLTAGIARKINGWETDGTRLA